MKRVVSGAKCWREKWLPWEGFGENIWFLWRVENPSGILAAGRVAEINKSLEAVRSAPFHSLLFYF